MKSYLVIGCLLLGALAMGQNGVVEVSVAEGKIAAPQVKGLVERSGTTVKVAAGAKIRFQIAAPFSLEHVAMSGSSPLTNLTNNALQAIGIGDSYVITLVKDRQHVDFVHLVSSSFESPPTTARNTTPPAVRSFGGNVYLKVTVGSPWKFEAFDTPSQPVEVAEYDGESTITVSLPAGLNARLRVTVGLTSTVYEDNSPVVLKPNQHVPISMAAMVGDMVVATLVLHPRPKPIGDRQELLVTFDRESGLLKDFVMGRALDFVEVPAGSTLSVAQFNLEQGESVVFIDVASQTVLGTFTGGTSAPRVSVDLGKRVRVSLLQNGKAIASGLVVAQGRQNNILRLDVGYVWAPMVDRDYKIVEEGGTKRVFSDNRGGFDSTPVLLTHYIWSERASNWLTRPLRRLTVDDGVKVAFSFGIPAPGSTTPMQYLAGFTALFGRREEVALTLGMVFGKVREPEKSFRFALDDHKTGDPIPMSSRSMVRPFLGISLRTG